MSNLRWIGLGRLPLPGEKRRVREAEEWAEELLAEEDDWVARDQFGTQVSFNEDGEPTFG